MEIVLSGSGFTVNDVVKVARRKAKVTIDKKALPKIKASRALVEDVVKNKKAVYGITTGFGKFSDVSVSESDCKKLQKNLIVSHACGVGEPLDIEIVRAMMALRINALAVGHSGISLDTLGMLAEMLNRDVIPVVPEKGSLGASGDLVPLAHMVLPMFGLGEAFFKGKRMKAEAALKRAHLSPIELTAKEGLALINGTQAMGAIASLAVADSLNLVKAADIIASVTIEALRGITDAFDPRIHDIRRHTGQINVALNLRTLLKGSTLVTRQGELRMQDAYALRCIPQIHGMSKDSLDFVAGVVKNEINAVTDNPLIFPKSGEAFSGGNFHGQYLSMSLDFLAIAVSELANVSERRTERLVNPQLSNGLPAFLIKNGGLNSGFMIPQYAAAALVSQNKVLSHPASVDSIPSSANQEDHVSMGMTAALKAREVVENVVNVLAIELFTACQALELRLGMEKKSGLGAGEAVQSVLDLVRKEVPFVEDDTIMSPHIAKCAELISSRQLVRTAEKAAGKLK